MPHLQKLYTELKGKGFEMIAVNANDTPELINRYIAHRHFTFPIVLGGKLPDYAVGKAYGVKGYPTNFLVGADGKIVWREGGFDEPALRNALVQLGIK